MSGEREWVASARRSTSPQPSFPRLEREHCRLFHLLRIAAAALPGAVATLAPLNAAQAWTYKVLHDFCASVDCVDGSNPAGELFLDSSGDLYGLAAQGGAHGKGVAYRLGFDAPTGKWKYKTLYSFCAKADCADGASPVGKVISDKSGYLYGVTYLGGNFGGDGGTAFALTPEPRGEWRLKTLYRFCAKEQCRDGLFPAGGLTYRGAQVGALYDGMSPLYGETKYGGVSDQGTLFSLTPDLDTGKWRHRKIHDFCTETQECDLTDGAFPTGALPIDDSDNLFGATETGGEDFAGTIFRLLPGELRKKWKEKILYAFCQVAGCPGGQQPVGVVRDANGNVYGMTAGLGANGKGGTLFKLTADGSFTVLHDFCSEADCADGHQPAAAPALDASGTLYGVTAIGGGHDIDEGKLGGGVVFELTAAGEFMVLHAFCAQANCVDGEDPFAGVTLDPAGPVFGTTIKGGKFGKGVLFELSPD